MSRCAEPAPKNKRALDGIKALSEKAVSKSSDVKDLPKYQLQSLINLYAQGKFQEALTMGSPLLKDFPNSFNLYNVIGAANKGLGKLEEAIDASNKALSLKPDYAEAWLNGAEALEKWNKLNELEIWLDNAIISFEIVPVDLRFMKCKDI